MTRALSVISLAILWVGLGVAQAGNKPSIAVLGLEVNDPNGPPTPADTQVAHELTQGLRARALAGTGPYQQQPGSDKELIDEKLLKNCDNEDVKCMSAIGGDLGADVLMYGHLKKVGGSYAVRVFLLDIRNSQVKFHDSSLPVAQAQGAAIQTWAKSIYNKLTGQADTGTVIVKLTINESGTILIDDAPKGNVTSGTGSVSNVPPGHHHLTIQIGGYKDWGKDISVTEGQTTNVGVDNLERAESGPGVGSGSGSGSNIDIGSGSGSGSGSGGGGGGGGHGTLRAIGFAALGLGAVAGGVWAYAYVTDISPYKGTTPSYTNAPPMGHLWDNGQCNTTAGKQERKGTMAGDVAFDKACNGYSMTQIAIPATIGLGVVGIGLLIYTYAIADHHSAEHADLGHRKRNRPSFAVIPVISPQLGGATVRFEF